MTLGLSDQANLLVVVYAYRDPDNPDDFRMESRQASEGAL